MTGPIDPDVDLREPAQRRELLRTHGAVLAVVSAGGGLGSLARFGLATWWPTGLGGFPWSTFTVNVVGCFLIGVLMIVITEVRMAHPLVRPFLGVGVLGGFTTFSAYAADIRVLIESGHLPLGMVYLAATLLCALPATASAIALTRFAHRRALLRRRVA